MADMDNSPEPGPEPVQLRFLRILVTVLTGVMILGLLTIIGLFVMRFQADLAPAPLGLPENLVLPKGVTAEAVTYTKDRILVVAEQGAVWVFSRDGELLGQMILDTQ